jgi:hypothetical protein
MKRRFKTGDRVMFKMPFQGRGMIRPEPRPYLVTKVDGGLIYLEGYGLPVPDIALALPRRVEKNPWKELRDEWQRFLAKVERGTA